VRSPALGVALLLVACTPPKAPEAGVEAGAQKARVRPLIDASFEGALPPGWSLHRINLKATEGGFAAGLLSLETSARAAADVSAVVLRHDGVLDWSEEAVRIELNLRWLERENASYLRAGLELVPEPEKPSKGVAVYYVGVPPAAKARRETVVRQTPASVITETDGWPEVEPDGRALRRVQLELLVSDSAIRVRENGGRERIIRTDIGFMRGRVQIVLRSHSNAPKRSVGIDRLIADRHQ
jgi:hypothetical protein